jgi:hypothetical protein
MYGLLKVTKTNNGKYQKERIFKTLVWSILSLRLEFLIFYLII